MIILLEEKSTIKSCASCLKEIIERFINLGTASQVKINEDGEAKEIEEKLQQDMNKVTYETVQEEK